MQQPILHTSAGLADVRRLALTALLGAAAAAASACADAPSEPADEHDHGASAVSPRFEQGLTADENRLLAEIRAATAKYHDVDLAVADGYVGETVCAKSAAGAMGVHFPNPTLIGFVPNSSPRTGTDATIDPLRPDILVYEPQPNGRMRLVAVEYMVFAAAWNATHTSPPSLLGVTFPTRTHGWMPHYELHLWLWRHNPNGLTAEWNPKVVCP